MSRSGPIPFPLIVKARGSTGRRATRRLSVAASRSKSRRRRGVARGRARRDGKRTPVAAPHRHRPRRPAPATPSVAGGSFGVSLRRGRRAKPRFSANPGRWPSTRRRPSAAPSRSKTGRARRNRTLFQKMNGTPSPTQPIDIMKMPVKDLRAALAQRRLETKGLKKVLQKSSSGCSIEFKNVPVARDAGNSKIGLYTTSTPSTRRCKWTPQLSRARRPRRLRRLTTHSSASISEQSSTAPWPEANKRAISSAALSSLTKWTGAGGRITQRHEPPRRRPQNRRLDEQADALDTCI